MLIGMAAIGCDKEPTVETAKEPKPATESKPSAMPMKLDQAVEQRLTWKVPAGWKEDATPRMMREATLLTEGEPPAEVVVTRLGGNFGEIGANINRWRGQVGLEPLADASTVVPELLKTPVGDAKWIKIQGPENSSLIAIVPQGQANWFFRLTGSTKTVTANEAKFKDLLASLAQSK